MTKIFIKFNCYFYFIDVPNVRILLDCGFAVIRSTLIDSSSSLSLDERLTLSLVFV